jgi:Protein kinase domain
VRPCERRIDNSGQDQILPLSSMSQRIDDAAISSGLQRILSLRFSSAEISNPSLGPSRPTDMPEPELSDWASFSTFLRPLPVTKISDSNVSYFDNGEPKYGVSFIVRPLVPDVDGKLGTLAFPTGKTLVLKSVRLPREEMQKTVETGNLSEMARQRLKHLCMEISVLMHPPLAAHRNIIKLLGFTQFPPNETTLPSLIMEGAEYGTLDEFLTSSVFERNNQTHQNQICADIADGLYALHECGIIHGDIKPANILICRHEATEFVAKIGDFAYSFVPAEGFPRWNFGTDRWEAPELHARENVMSKESDIYSFGLVAWYVFIQGHDPFDNNDGKDVLRMKKEGDIVMQKAFEDCEDGIRRSILAASLHHIAINRDCAILSSVRRKLLKGDDFETQFSDQALRSSPNFLVTDFVGCIPRRRWVH